MATAFQRSLLRVAQPLPQAPSIAPQLTPTQPEPSIGEALVDGFMSGNLTANAIEDIRLGLRAAEIKPDPNFKRGDYLKEKYPALLELSHYDDNAARRLGEMNSAQEVDLFAQEQQATQERMRALAAHPILGTAATLAGALIDLPSLVPGLGLVRGATTVAKTANAARAIAASRLALMGGVEAGAQVALQYPQDLTANANDIAKWMGFGALGGGALGALFPKLGLVAAEVEHAGVAAERAAAAEAAAAARAARIGEEAPEGLSAATTPAMPHDPLQDLPERAGSIGHTVIDKLTGGLSEHLRSPIQQTLNWVTDFKDNPGVQNFYNFFKNIARVEVASAAEAALASVRVKRSVEEVMTGLRRQRATNVSEHRGLYVAMQKDMEGSPLLAGSIRRSREAESQQLSYPAVPFWMKGITENEFRWLADQWGRARSAGANWEDFMNVHFKGASDIDSLKLQKHITKAANLEDTFWQGLGKQLLKHNLITEDEFIGTHYRPRHPNIEAVLTNRDEFTHLIVDAIKRMPDDAFVAEFAPGKTWSTLSTAEKNDILDEWMAKNEKYFQEAADKRLADAETALKDEHAKGVEIALRGKRLKVDELQASHDKLQKKLNASKTMEGKKRWLKDLESVEAKLNEAKEKLAKAERAVADAEGLKDELRGVAARSKDRATRLAARKAANKIERAESTVAKAEVGTRAGSVEAQAQSPLDRAKNIVANYLGEAKGNNPYATLRADAHTGTPGELMARIMDFTAQEAALDPRLNKFFITNPDALFNAWYRHAGSRIAFSEALGTATPHDLIAGIVKDMPSELQPRAKNMLEFLLGEYTGMNAARQNRTLNDLANTANSYNVINMLGGVGLTALGDTAAVHFAQRVPNLMRTFQGLFSPLNIGKARNIVQDLQALDEHGWAALLETSDAMIEDLARARNVMDLGDPGFAHAVGTPGSGLSYMVKMAGGLRDMTTRTFIKATGLYHWNKGWSRFVNLTLAQDLMKYAKVEWDKIPLRLRQAYATVGIGEPELARFGKLLDEHGTIKTPRGVELPNTKAWPEARREQFDRAIDTLGRNGIVNNFPGSVPQMFRTPVGRVIFQFLSFGYSIQQKLVRPLMQNPRDALAMQTLLLAATFGALGDAAREHMKGKDKEWFKSWETPQGAAQRMYTIFNRSAFSVAMASWTFDMLAKTGGHGINKALEAHGQAPLFPQAAKLRGDIASSLVGPSLQSANQIFQAATTLGDAVFSQDQDAIDKLPERIKKIVPFHNLIYIQALDHLLGDNTQ